MSAAKAMKLKEYGTNVISHDLSYSNDSVSSKVRLTDTFKSRVQELEVAEKSVLPRAGYKSAVKVHENSKERLFSERPFTTPI